MGWGGTFEHMARIALNGRLLVPGKLEGIGRFTLRCFQGLVKERPEDEFLLIVDQPHNKMFELGPNVRVQRMPIPGRRPWLLRWWFGWPLSALLKMWNADAFVSLEGPLATRMPAHFPQMTVIHDLNFEHRPDWLPKVWADYYRSSFRGFAQRASLLGTVSEFSRQDLAKHYNLDASPIKLFPNAADQQFRPCDDESKWRAREKWTSGKPYWVYVGSLHPRKNIQGLLHAFDQYCQNGGQWDLLVVGVAMWSNDTPLHDGLYADRVHLSGRLSNNDIVEAMAGAEALVFVPWFEGFGIPLLEAMACEVPVIASNVTALPEVCGDAAFALVSPDSSEDIAEAMLRLEQNPTDARAAAERGISRCRAFSWEKTASLVSQAVDDLLETS